MNGYYQIPDDIDFYVQNPKGASFLPLKQQFPKHSVMCHRTLATWQWDCGISSQTVARGSVQQVEQQQRETTYWGKAPTHSDLSTAILRLHVWPLISEESGDVTITWHISCHHHFQIIEVIAAAVSLGAAAYRLRNCFILLCLSW